MFVREWGWIGCGYIFIKEFVIEFVFRVKVEVCFCLDTANGRDVSLGEA